MTACVLALAVVLVGGPAAAHDRTTSYSTLNLYSSFAAFGAMA